jgi:hypothetical protein
MSARRTCIGAAPRMAELRIAELRIVEPQIAETVPLGSRRSEMPLRPESPPMYNGTLIQGVITSYPSSEKAR